MRLASVDQLKGLAIMAVVVYHLDDWRLQLDRKAVLIAAGWCVFAFLFAAGVLHRLKAVEMPLGEFTRTRARRLLIPFVLIGVVMCSLRQVLEQISGGDLRLRYPPSLGGKIIGHLTLQEPMVAYPLYFFVLLFVVSVLFKLVQGKENKITRLNLMAAASLAGVVVCWFLTRKDHCTGFGLEMILMGLFQYTAGYMMAKEPAGKEAQAVWWLAAAIGLAGIFLHVPAFILAMVPMLLFTALSGMKSRLAWLSFIGQRSGTIFAYHIPFITGGLIVIFYRLGLPVGLNLTATFLFTLMLCTGLHWGLHRWSGFKWFRV